MARNELKVGPKPETIGWGWVHLPADGGTRRVYKTGGGDGTIGFERAIYRRMEGLNETSQAGGPG